ncbi:lysylphosphatidylglycerol synthase domain-containing protein [Candidatus Venteria ishoeyi]|uniref:Lysylphosphatidylglycerol synthase TM region n=1 Tax=Candidatus Venteria ishoeyi TaxID=1899563 RepID=A0A1H6FCT9_9GAMM|nr:lysylphosphatidylglycerol synthase domain-containing protein [Candidatus Venteria ishoeyi]SEH07139.1 Uncharacterised protein [Candidatus Venteria ishoeyi]
MPYKKIISRLQLVFIIIALLFITKLILESYDDLLDILVKAKFQYFFIALFFGVASHFFAAWCTKSILNTYNINIPYFFILKTHITRLPNKYLPGGIWHTVSRAFDFHQKGVKGPYLTVLFLLESLLAVTISFIIGGSGLFFLSNVSNELKIILLSSSIIALITLVLLPFLMNFFILRKNKKINLYRFFIVL